MEKSELHNFTFDELQVGQFASLSRTLTKKDIDLFAFVSGDVNPAHMDKEFATLSPFHDVIGHGMWSGALISTVLGTMCPGPGTIYLGQEMKFVKPVRIGDEITVKLIVKSKHDTKPIVVFDCICTNGKGETVVEGKATVLAPTKRMSVPRPDLPDVTVYEKDHYKDILARFKQLGSIKTAVVHPVESNVIEAVAEAVAEGLIDPILIGPKQRILEAAKSCNIKIDGWPIVHTEHSHAAAEKAVELAARGDVEALMKGSLHTDELLGSVVRSGSGLRTERRLSHAYVMSIPTYHKPLFITDAAINIAPTLEEKADICQNTINFWHLIFGDDKLPKVAILSAVETVTARMPSTLDAACLCKMADRGQIKGALLDGPLAFDNAISEQAVRDKGIVSLVAGDADILVVPNIESGNMLAKQLTFLGHADAAGIVLGARVPIILTSRADTLRTRLLSCVGAIILAKVHQKEDFK
jgi:phosphate acetyltransferase